MESPTFLPSPNIGVEDFAVAPHSDDVVNNESSFPSSTHEAENHNYNYSGIYDDSSAQSAQEENTDDEIARQNGTTTASSRSSISSLPASVAASAIVHPVDAATPTKGYDDRDNLAKDSPRYINSPGRNTEIQYGSPFRHASSVRAMQMRDDDVFSFADRRRDSQMTGRMSTFSGRSSTTSSPTKRRARTSPQKESKLKKEYPLVLLHCTILPPKISIPNAFAYVDFLQDILPEEYLRRWRLLNDRVGENDEIKARGVLIPHPKGDYDLLEERLLESLELTQPRIRSDHYLGIEDVTLEHETDDDMVPHGVPCPDCGRRIETGDDRKWEIKVYAANGLMRAGAWSAAWSEMEKIDVEVSLWLPDDIRRQAETALREISSTLSNDEQRVEDREREVYGAAGKVTQEDIDGLKDNESTEHGSRKWSPSVDDHFRPSRAKPQPSLADLALAYIRNLLDDRKSAGIIFLSILVLWLALNGGRPQSLVEVETPAAPIVMSNPITRTSVVTTTMTQLTTTTTIATTSTTTLAIDKPEIVPLSSETATQLVEVSSAIDIELLETES